MRLRSLMWVAGLCWFPAMALAQNLSVNDCRTLFIKALQIRPSEYGAAWISVKVKVGWLGNGETIRRVGLYGRTTGTDLGNLPQCFSGAAIGRGKWRTVDPLPPYNAPDAEYGEYVFDLQTFSGTGVAACPGVTYSTEAVFFVETNRHTYWLNPEYDRRKNFVFAIDLYRQLESEGGFYNWLPTTRPEWRVYNPLGCR